MALPLRYGVVKYTIKNEAIMIMAKFHQRKTWNELFFRLC